MSDTKLVNIARLMTTYNFEIEELPDNMKCVQCKLLLKDACQVPCGCRFCRSCIDDMMARGGEFCIGVSEDCRESPLSCYQTDYSSNKIILKLTVKCPREGCVHKCQLANMEEHLRECLRKNEECPFRELGCTQDKLATEEICGHLQNENRSHSEILIGVITNINREIEVLKQRDEDRSREIETLKHELVLKDGEIRSIMDQMIHVQNENKSIKNDLKSIKEEKEHLAARVRILSREIEREIVERRENDELDSARVIEHVDREIAAVTGLIGSNKDEMRSVKGDIGSINQEVQSIKSNICSMKSKIQSIQSLQEPLGLGEIDASCVWLITGDIESTSWNWRDKQSEYFSGKVHQYKYRLGSGNYLRNAELCFQLHVLTGPNDEQLPWPFHGTLVITVSDNDRRDVCMTDRNERFVDRPSDNCYAWSETIRFRHSELKEAGLNLTEGVRVSCMIIPDVGKYRKNYYEMRRD